MALMKSLLFFALASLALADQVEFYDLDGRRADPCVNLERLDARLNRPDCTENSVAAWPTTTYLIPHANSEPARQLPAGQVVTLYGKFFPVAAPGTLRLSRAGVQSCAAAALEPVGDLAEATPLTVQVITGTTGKEMRFEIPRVWTTIPEEEIYPRNLCWIPDGAPEGQWTGIRIGPVWNCDNSDRIEFQCAQRFRRFNFPGQLDDVQKAMFVSRTTCCVNQQSVQTNLRVNQCINTNVESCCGSASVLQNMKCCSTQRETIAYADGICPCRRQTMNVDCPFGEQCCLPTKYIELVPPRVSQQINWLDNFRFGECYNPQQFRCCETGQRYDSGTDQCCSINGIQTLNVPCPCGKDTDCYGGEVNYRRLDSTCCMQTAPAPQEQTTNCDKYLNYPAGTGHFSQQTCLGHCIDTRYQTCCNGRSCIREYEKCCNSTCCNRFNGTCQSGTSRPSSTKNNWIEFNIPYDVCTTVEQMDVIRGWWMFVLPTALLILSLLGLAIALVFAGRVEHCARHALEKGVIFTALVGFAFVVPTYFSPVYKYGVVVVFVCLFAIITAASRKLNMYIACVILQFFVLIYIIDPFHGNDYLNLAIDRASATNRADPRAAGLWHSTTRMWDNHETCWDFYIGYFKFDQLLRDDRIDEPFMNNPAFGYCSRGWVTTLMVLEGFVYISMISQFILSIILLAARGSKLQKNEQELKYE